MTAPPCEVEWLKKKKICVLGGANSTVFLSPPEWLSVSCRSLYVHRLLGSPSLEVTSWRVTVTIRTGCSRGTWYSRLSRKTRRSPLAVPAVLTIARSSWLTCDHKLILGYSIHQSIHLSIHLFSTAASSYTLPIHTTMHTHTNNHIGSSQFTTCIFFGLQQEAGNLENPRRHRESIQTPHRNGEWTVLWFSLATFVVPQSTLH